MKKIYYTSLIFVFITAHTIMAQSIVKLEINHQLGVDSFAFNLVKSNNLSQDFSVTRLQYYIAEVKLEHDGGNITPMDSFWILVDASAATSHSLGMHSITTLEAVHFSIGVDTTYNHLDPAQYSTGHPLAPVTPAMHWGWQSGYRFLVIEGKKGADTSETYELHSLEDPYYFSQRIPTAGEVVDGELIITLNADYTKIMEDLDLDGVIIDHGTSPKNIKTLRNMHNFVFKSSEGNGNTNTLGPVGIAISTEYSNSVKVFPNPVTNGVVNLTFENSLHDSYRIEIRDVTGKILRTVSISNQSNNYELPIVEKSGIYFLSILDDEAVISTHRIVVSQ